MCDLKLYVVKQVETFKGYSIALKIHMERVCKNEWTREEKEGMVRFMFEFLS